jgi:hypothetical protein
MCRGHSVVPRLAPACTNNSFRSVSRMENEAVLDRMQARIARSPAIFSKPVKRSSIRLAVPRQESGINAVNVMVPPVAAEPICPRREPP